ncbi:MAG: hypothetical protein QG635_2036 [Bacteroidota bacterium]|nr:hypothetical protein [Bacteroidota bacterium]
METIIKTKYRARAKILKPKDNRLTYEDYYNLNDGIRYELIKGELFMSPAPIIFHQHYSIEFSLFLKKYVKDNDLGIVLVSPADVILDNYNTVQPDILFIAKENYNIIKERGIFGAPDVIFEILSPSTAKTDRHTKKEIYERFGVKEYWIIDLKNRFVEVFINISGKYELSASGSENEIVKSEIISGFEADLGKQFSALDFMNKLG